MLRAFRSEWTKLLRPGQLLGSWGTMAGFALLLTFLLLGNAKSGAPDLNQTRGPPSLSFSAFESADGAVFTFHAAAQVLGIAALVIGAASVANEYTAGTLKALLVREPRRPVLVLGKLAGLATFVAAGLAIALVLSAGVSWALAAGRGIDMSAWWTAEGFSQDAQAYGNVLAAAVVWMLMGATLAVALRSGFAAIGLGIAYPLLVESLLGLVPGVSGAVKYMPGRVLQSLVAGHVGRAFGETTPALGYAEAGLLAAAYGLAFLAVCLAVVAERDVA